MSDVQKTHWKSLTNPNYLGEYSLPNGQDLTVTIDYVKKETVVSTNGKKEEEVVAHLIGGHKPFILNKTNMKQIEKLTGSRFVEDWKGKSIIVYFDPTIKFGKEIVGGLRIRPFLPEIKSVQYMCSNCQKPISSSQGKSAEWVAKYTKQKYGTALCADCASARKNETTEREDVANNEDHKN